MNNTKTDKFGRLFKQKSFIEYFGTSGAIDEIFNILTEDEIDKLIAKNVVFIRSCGPASTIEINDIEKCETITLINFDKDHFDHLLPNEFIAILLHEIGHIFNPGLDGIEKEYAADDYAYDKGYGRWIIESLEKGTKNNWFGFEEEECKNRIKRIKQRIQ